jgi:hypothetical protein
MPGRDRTGPMGEGPMTGWGYGLCSGNPTPVYGGWGFGRGYAPGFGRGFGWGGGRGWRNRFRTVDIPGWASFGPAWPAATPLTPKQETDILKAQAKDMEETLGHINQRLKELEKEKK